MWPVNTKLNFFKKNVNHFFSGENVCIRKKKFHKRIYTNVKANKYSNKLQNKPQENILHNKVNNIQIN